MTDQKNANGPAWWQPGVELFIQISGWLVGPPIAAVILGRWLDERYASKPKWMLICVTIAFIATCTGIYKEAKVAVKRMDKLPPSKKQ